MDDLTPTRPAVRAAGAACEPLLRASRLRGFGTTHPGLHRPENEDAFAVAPELGLAVVADGVASSGGGGIAAATVVAAVHAFVAQEATQAVLAAARPDSAAEVTPLLMAVADDAHQRVREAARRSGFENMGTTLAMVLFVAGHAFVLHAGDSRVHRLRDGRMEQVTEDHTALNQWIERWGPAPESVIAQWEHVIVRAVSTRMASVRPEIWVEPARPGDLFLLSTDGLTKVVPEHVIREIVLGAPDLEMAALCLIDAALAAGGPDNVTAALIRYEGGGSPAPRGEERREDGEE